MRKPSPVNEADAKFELLKQEMQLIQQGIRAFDTAMFAIKGWCVTVVAAIAGFAVSKNKPLLLLISLLVCVVFWLLDSHYKSIQRTYIRRDLRLERVLRGRDVLAMLSTGELKIPGNASRFLTPRRGYRRKLAWEIGMTWREAKTPIMYNLYLLLALSIGIITIILWRVR